MSISVIDAFEEIQIEQEEGERDIVPAGKRQIRGEFLLDVLSVVHSGQGIARGRFVEQPLVVYFHGVLENKLEHGVLPEHHPISISQNHRRYLFVAHKRPVGAVEIAENGLRTRRAWGKDLHMILKGLRLFNEPYDMVIKQFK